MRLSLENVHAYTSGRKVSKVIGVVNQVTNRGGGGGGGIQFYAFKNADLSKTI